MNLSKEWCLNMANLEGDSEIGAGLAARDPVSSAFIAGTVARLYDLPRVVPPDYDDDEAKDWLWGYDA